MISLLTIGGAELDPALQNGHYALLDPKRGSDRFVRTDCGIDLVGKKTQLWEPIPEALCPACRAAKEAKP